jgi:hypothetical protein
VNSLPSKRRNFDLKTLLVSKKINLILLSAVILFTTAIITPTANSASTETNQPKNAREALQMAQKNNQYLFLLFYKDKNGDFKSLEAVAKNYIQNSSEKIMIYEALTTEAKESEMVMTYANESPIPSLFVFAPNGAVTGGFPERATSQELKQCFVSKLELEILKTLQDRRIVLVVLQNDKTKFNKESLAAATDFCNDRSFQGRVNLIKADPADPKIKDFLSQCKLKPGLTESTLLLFVDIGKIAGAFPGKTTKEAIIKSFQVASTSTNEN